VRIYGRLLLSRKLIFVLVVVSPITKILPTMPSESDWEAANLSTPESKSGQLDVPSVDSMVCWRALHTRSALAHHLSTFQAAYIQSRQSSKSSLFRPHVFHSSSILIYLSIMEVRLVRLVGSILLGEPRGTYAQSSTGIRPRSPCCRLSRTPTTRSRIIPARRLPDQDLNHLRQSSSRETHWS
jgi:hypothetical protein